MKKILLSVILATSICLNGFCNNDNLKLSTLFSSKIKNENTAWVGTFQLVFNDMKNHVIKRKIEFINEKPTKELNGLNNEKFNSSMLNENSYYKSYGKTSPLALEKIKKGILEKFNETSDILDNLDWSEGRGKYYAYAMLKKDFNFYYSFDDLKKSSFNFSKEKYPFFGIDEKTKGNPKDNVRILFYNNENDFAIKLHTKENDGVYLYKTSSNKSFDKLYNEMNKKAQKYRGETEMSSNDTLKIPNLKFKTQREYPELCDKTIKGTDNMYFSTAIETLQFELDKQGGKVKSEAILMTKCNMILPSKKQAPKKLHFDKTFVLFLTDANKKDPYLALKVKDLKNLNK